MNVKLFCIFAAMYSFAPEFILQDNHNVELKSSVLCEKSIKTADGIEQYHNETVEELQEQYRQMRATWNEIMQQRLGVDVVPEKYFDHIGQWYTDKLLSKEVQIHA